MKNKKVWLTRIIALLCFFALIFVSLYYKNTDTPKTPEKINLVMWGMFDSTEIYADLISAYEQANPDVKINYYKISDDTAEYEKLLLGELAEGRGPDIFMFKNTWIENYAGKILPLPDTLQITPEGYKQTFVPAVSSVLVRDNQIFGIPLFVDNLALYYNKKILAQKISNGIPSATWDDLQSDAAKISVTDKSAERFKTSAIALGRGDNIARATDIFYLMLLQAGVNLYDASATKAAFATNTAQKVLEYFLSYGNPLYQNYSWNEAMTQDDATKEISPFARGKTAMIFGYSYLFEDIKTKIKDLQKLGENTIEISDIAVAKIPGKSAEENFSLANFFPYTVSKNSAHKEASWRFLLYLCEKENLRIYHEKTKLPTPVFGLIEEQKNEEIYGIFAEQNATAKTYKILDDKLFDAQFLQIILDASTGRATTLDALKNAEKNISDYMENFRTIKNSSQNAQ